MVDVNLVDADFDVKGVFVDQRQGLDAGLDLFPFFD